MAWFSSYLLLVLFFSVTGIFASEIYTNVWAVKIRGNQREVEEVALQYGFLFDSHVSLSTFCPF